MGPNKKLAKRTAAEQMLQLLGYSRPSPQPQKSSIKTGDSVGSPSNSSGDKKVTFMDQDSTTGRSHSHLEVSQWYHFYKGYKSTSFGRRGS